MSKPKVLIIGKVFSESDNFKEFCEKFEVVTYLYLKKESFIDALQKEFHDISAIWVGHGGLMSRYDGSFPLNSDTLDYFPKSLKIIALPSIGVDRHDLSELKKRSIILTNTPALASGQVADTALYHVLNAFRFYSALDSSLRKFKNTLETKINLTSEIFDPETGCPIEQDFNIPFSLGSRIGGRDVRSPKGRIAGIVGLGGIGQELAKRLNVIGMQVHYCKRNKLTDEEFNSIGVTSLVYHATFEELLPIVDILIFCVPLAPDTHYLLNKETIYKCKKGIKIVNVGRGKCINENDLIEALKSGQVSFAGLDVFEDEPRVSENLLKRLDVSVTPHSGSSTIDNEMLSAKNCQDNIINVLLEGGNGLTAVN
ncbi:hypothetical protein PACTADRAFT_4094 [Pachysolen tannophilus NRRL Y-2460]|uniref:D-isomer specific 2-hydroxyacid dehydrogenase NAD-binding domain-containing protein n=1 Tax=Pachysolen tannophilus NRRL Y-2460 TaxID=669874 RepID=A0A1E4TQW7_PACTA|nr:hypothetical protein PACTADRAFT_4094 [Pachysolen tannophilus NRRL Y-2460]